MEERKECWYSIVRYCADDLAGEVVNVGVVMHSFNQAIETKYLILDENSPKIKAIANSNIDVALYKSYKDKLEYYLKESIHDLLGSVGEIGIGSPVAEDFLEKLFEYYKNQKLTLTRPSFSLTADYEKLFNKIFETYIGSKYLQVNDKHVSVKKYVKEVFEEHDLLGKKVMYDFPISPIKDLEDLLKINVDFGYKNGVWNYLQAVPQFSGPSKNTEWFAKMKLMFENIEDDAKMHLLFKSSEILDHREFNEVLAYLTKMDKDRIVQLDLDEESKVIELCRTIESDAHDIEEILIS